MKRGKREPLRIAAGVAAIAWIAWTWVKKDAAALYAKASKEQLLAMTVTAIVVMLIKLGALTGAVYVIRRIAGKIVGKK